MIPNSLAQTYAARLRELGEPSLLDAAKSKLNTEYRVLFVAGFCASVIRLTLETEGDAQLRAVSTVHTDINGRCALESPRSSDILREQLTGFETVLRDSDFWAMPSFVRASPGASLLGPSEDWVLEGVKDGQYHVVMRGEPKNGPFRLICEALQKMARTSMRN